MISLLLIKKELLILRTELIKLPVLSMDFDKPYLLESLETKKLSEEGSLDL